MNKDAKQAITGSLGRYEAFINPYKEKEEEALKAKSEVEAAKDVMQAGREVAKATGVSALEKARAKGREEIPSIKETESLVKEAATPFVPTKETAGDMAQLFALTNILGFAMGAGGKRNAQAAMAGMNGMLEGYQKGRMDLYKKEKDIFETNMKQLKTRIDLLDRLTKQAEKTLESNFQAGVAELDVAYAQTGADFLKQMQQKLGVARTLEHVSKLKADADKVFNIMERDRVRAEEKAAAERRHREQIAHSEKLAKMRIEGGAGGRLKPGAKVTEGYVADIQLKADIDDISKDLKTNPKLAEMLKQYRVEAFLSEESKVLNQVLDSEIPSELRSFLTKVRDMRNNYYLNISGKAVTGGEALRSYGTVPQPGDSPQAMIDKMSGMANRVDSAIAIKQQLYGLPKVDLRPGSPTRLSPGEDYSKDTESSSDAFRQEAIKMFGSYDPSKYRYGKDEKGFFREQK